MDVQAVIMVNSITSELHLDLVIHQFKELVIIMNVNSGLACLI